MTSSIAIALFLRPDGIAQRMILVIIYQLIVMEQKRIQQRQFTSKDEASSEEQLQPSTSKKQKLDDSIQINKANANQQVHQKFDQKQTECLIREIKMIQEYYKIISTEIKHQEDSISTLKPPITQRYPELANRKQLMIEKGQQNIKFIDLLIQPYKELLYKQLIKEKQSEKLNRQLGHTHEHGHRKYQSITNLFIQTALQWGNHQQVHYNRRVLQLMQKYWEQITKNIQTVQRGQRKNILIVGFGTGRILSQIESKFKSKQLNILLQGHQAEVQHYIAAEYFLNNCTKQTAIYPYIHNFSNFIKEGSPYREVTVPFSLKEHSYYFPLTWGKFAYLYKSHDQQWDCLVTIYNNYQIEDVLTYIKIVYKILSPGGIWIDLCTSNFSRNIIQLSFREYENILDNSQFKLLERGSSSDVWYEDKECIMNEKRITHYRVMQK